MSRIASLLSRQVPLYVWLPIVLACGVAGFIASALRPVRPIPSQPNIPRSEAPNLAPATASEAPTRTAGSQISRALGPPRDAVPITLPTDEIDLPTPASSVAERHEEVANDSRVAAPPAPAALGPPRDAASITLPIDDIDLPTLASSVAERHPPPAPDGPPR